MVGGDALKVTLQKCVPEYLKDSLNLSACHKLYFSNSLNLSAHSPTCATLKLVKMYSVDFKPRRASVVFSVYHMNTKLHLSMEGGFKEFHCGNHMF